MKLVFIQKVVYGKTLFYPNNDAAVSICAVAGANKKTMTVNDLKTLKAGGFDIEVSVKPIDLDTLLAEPKKKTRLKKSVDVSENNAEV